MNWFDAREKFPGQWLLIEALNAHSINDKRILDKIAVLGAFATSPDAIRNYRELHTDNPDRELYVFHTSRETLDITERQWLGIRV